MRPTTAEAAGALIAAAVRAPRALFWGPRSFVRRTLHDFVWGREPPHCHGPPPREVWRVSCEPPCYGCQTCWRRHV
jgi:hypothetical protein